MKKKDNKVEKNCAKMEVFIALGRSQVNNTRLNKINGFFNTQNCIWARGFYAYLILVSIKFIYFEEDTWMQQQIKAATEPPKRKGIEPSSPILTRSSFTN